MVTKKKGKTEKKKRLSRPLFVPVDFKMHASDFCLSKSDGLVSLGSCTTTDWAETVGLVTHILVSARLKIQLISVVELMFSLVVWLIL